MKSRTNRLAESFLFLWVACLVALPLEAQTQSLRLPSVEQMMGQKQAPELPAPQGFRQYVSQGKLQLSLDDAIRLALANNTDVQLDQTQIDSAKYAIDAARGPFDPAVTSTVNTIRTTSPTYSQLQGAATLSTLNQQYQVGIAQTLETGTTLQASVSANKLSSNSSFNTLNPSVAGNFSFSFSQPLLRGRGLLPNRGPILIAQRSLAQSRAAFEQEVANVILNVVAQYWNVVEARESLVVQQKSLDEAQQTYNRDKKALEKGALPPLDIYRSESQVASRRVAEIQSEYSLKQAEDVFRRVIGADIDPNIRALDVDLTESPEPGKDLMTIDIATALEKALTNRPELQAQRLQLENDNLNIRIARNGLEPNLQLTGQYQSTGLNQTSNGPIGEALDQTFGFRYPTYGVGLNLTLPIKNHAAEANLGNAQVSKRRDLYLDRQIRQQVTLDVTNAVHQLDQSKLSTAAAKIALDLAQKNLEAEQRKYELGAETLFVVLETQTELAQAEQDLLQAEVGYQLAVTSLNYATGDLLDNFRIQIADLTK